MTSLADPASQKKNLSSANYKGDSPHRETRTRSHEKSHAPRRGLLWWTGLAAVWAACLTLFSGCQWGESPALAARSRGSAAPTLEPPAAAPASINSTGNSTAKSKALAEAAHIPSIVPRPPHAERDAHIATVHGQQIQDDYFWLQDKEDHKVLDYLTSENRYADAVLQHTEELQKKLYQEFLDRTKQDDQTVPELLSGYYYYNRWEKDRQYNIHCRRHGNMEAPEEIVLDENDLASKHDYVALGAMEVSPDQRWLLYGIDNSGSEQFTLHVKDLKEGKLYKDEISNAGEAVAWANDNRTIFYTTRDASNRPYRLYRHVMGADPKQDVLVYEEPDKAFFLSIARTRSEKYLVMELASNTTSEVRYLDASQPLGAFQIIEPRKQGVEYSVRHQGDTFWIVTNDQARNFRLMSAPIATPDRAHWQEVIPNRDDVKLESIEAFADHLVLLERMRGLPTLRIRDVPSGETHAIEFTEPVYEVTVDNNPEYHSHQLRYTFTSPLTPDSVYEYDVAKHTQKLLKRDSVGKDFDASKYQTERIEATAADGTRIPISLVYRKGLVRNGRNPTLMYAYGAYGVSEDPQFDIARLSLLDRGFIYAVAHVRGGGELGRAWYEAGKLKHKPTSFTDFISCAEHLVKQKYTSPQRLVVTGASAGGLLVGAVVNMRPDLFHVAIADVPFVDVLHTMLDPKMPLTVTEFEEWGNPQQRDYFDLLRSYSPYENVRAQSYPHMLVRGSLNDTRVSYWEPAKWVAKLRATKKGDNLLLLKVDLEAGHNGASGRYDYLDSQATEYAFMLDCLGISE
ncbi:MAG: S9 family peptidase [Planctomycetia bacterium]|nr:S9 family peptidase [Planctomycetia bacterium]